ncbi:helix-turn-helix transcriptional regulator [Lysinibacillus sp. FSL R7-0073]|uniref:helix-turn-helix domain-containing protein n=1 Tax=Lysinibacillus sp. FSL R7-0073 TaxID=2921669 RepID=UPI0030F8D0D8
MQNNFRVILAKKKIKMSDVVEGTGLSRNTIRALFYETAKGIQFQTLEALCIYLNCEVGELFEIEKEAV